MAFNFIDYTFVNELEMEYNGDRTLMLYCQKSQEMFDDVQSIATIILHVYTIQIGDMKKPIEIPSQ